MGRSNTLGSCTWCSGVRTQRRISAPPSPFVGIDNGIAKHGVQVPASFTGVCLAHVLDLRVRHHLWAATRRLDDTICDTNSDELDFLRW
jgi:hypothetical protein